MEAHDVAGLHQPVEHSLPLDPLQLCSKDSRTGQRLLRRDMTGAKEAVDQLCQHRIDVLFWAAAGETIAALEEPGYARHSQPLWLLRPSSRPSTSSWSLEGIWPWRHSCWHTKQNSCLQLRSLLRAWGMAFRRRSGYRPPNGLLGRSRNPLLPNSHCRSRWPAAPPRRSLVSASSSDSGPLALDSDPLASLGKRPPFGRIFGLVPVAVPVFPPSRWSSA
mmetsp:Transcript_67973/g.122493  ORF Transcript_67973/g.122493 Transcript_67973/m.122493 type:complete len:219 (+) Transcript_67973:567-1223(+)